MSVLLVVLGDGETYDAIENARVVEVPDEVYDDDDFDGKVLKDAVFGWDGTPKEDGIKVYDINETTAPTETTPA